MELFLLKCRLPSCKTVKSKGSGLSGTSNSGFPDQANKNAGCPNEFESAKKVIL